MFRGGATWNASGTVLRWFLLLIFLSFACSQFWVLGGVPLGLSRI